MSWNYRIIKVPYNGHSFYYLYEIYYNEDGERDGRSANPVMLAGYDDLEDMKRALELMFKAFENPVIEMSWEEYKS